MKNSLEGNPGEAQIAFYTIVGVKIGEMKRDVVYRTRIVYTVAVGTYNAKGVVLSPN